MQYQFTAEQSEFKDSLRKFVHNHYDYESRRQYVKSELGYSPDYWRQLSELGVLGLPFAEEYGGLDMGLGYLMAVADEFGRGLVLEPVFASVVLAGRLLAAAENDALKTALIPAVIAGESILALAWEEATSKGNPLEVSTTVRRDNDQLLINGTKQAVLAGSQADYILVTARNDGGELGLYLLQSNVAGMSATSYTVVDGQRASNLTFDNVRIPASAALFDADASACLQRIIDESLIVLGAEAVGAADKLIEITAEYCRTRKQFGMPISTFQALQHRLADMYIAGEKMRSLMWAGVQADSDSAIAEAAAMLKAEIGRSGRYVGQQAVQLHGGIGMTDELNVGAYFKHLTVMDLLFGSRDYHLKRLVNRHAA